MAAPQGMAAPQSGAAPAGEFGGWGRARTMSSDDYGRRQDQEDAREGPDGAAGVGPPARPARPHAETDPVAPKGGRLSSSRSHQHVAVINGDSAQAFKISEHKPLGQGSFGRVFLGVDSESGSFVAVKELTIDPSNTHDVMHCETLQNEVAMHQNLRHPHIVAYLGHKLSVDPAIRTMRLYVFLEYLAGGTLREFLKGYGGLGHPLLHKYVYQLLLGIGYLHSRSPRPIAHRDLKPSNILLDLHGALKISDFGCSKRVMLGTQDQGSFVGTLRYMAPEAFEESEPIGLPADIWAVGCVAAECTTAQEPWSAKKATNFMALCKLVCESSEVPELGSDCDDQMAQLILSCFARPTQQRPTAMQLLVHPAIRGVADSAAISSLAAKVGSEETWSAARSYV